LRHAALALATFVVATLALAARADAYVYFTSITTNSIARANLDGNEPNYSFITDTQQPTGIAVDGRYIYWANISWGENPSGSIGRANLDGSEPDPTFIENADSPIGVAVDGSHIYWAESGFGGIGRANLDGSEPQLHFVPGPEEAFGVAVDSAHIYFTTELETVWRANLDGSEVDPSFIHSSINDLGLALDGAHLYWATNGGVGRANLNGTEPNPSFVSVPGGRLALSVAVDGGHIYWADGLGNEIGRSNLDGTGVNPAFINTSDSFGVAVDSLKPAPTIADLIASVKALKLDKGTENSLLQKLNNAQKNVTNGKTATACGQLADFISQVTALKGKKIIPASAADNLIKEAQEVRSSLGCSP
jgi:hypothetical protein